MTCVLLSNIILYDFWKKKISKCLQGGLESEPTIYLFHNKSTQNYSKLLIKHVHEYIKVPLIFLHI